MGLIQNDLLDYYIGEVSGLGGTLSGREQKALELLLAELEQENLLAKIRYLALFIGDSAIAFQIPAIFRNRMTLNGTPTITYGRRAGIQVAGNATNALKTGFIPASNGLNRRNHFKAVYSLAVATSGVLFGGGTAPGSVYNGPYLGFHSVPTFQSYMSGAVVNYANTRLGLQSVTANTTNVISRNRYAQLQSVANPATAGTEPTGESLVLNHWNSTNNFASNGSLGALVEGVALTQQQAGFLSGILDRFHYRIDRRQALDMVFAGDSITQGTNGLVEGANRYSAQVAASIGVTENNQGVSGSALQSGSWDGTIAPWSGRYTTQIINQTPAFVGIMIGTNDIYIGSDYNVLAYSSTLTTMLNDLINAGIYRKNIFLSSIPWASDAWYAANPIGSRGKVETYNRAIRTIANSTGVNFVDTYDYMTKNGSDSLLADNLHPNDAGARTIAENWVKQFLVAV